MTETPLAETWATAIKRAQNLNPSRIAATINAEAPNGLRSARYDAVGSRTTSVKCDDPERCFDGPEDHSHQITSDPTGNAATNGHRDDDTAGELLHLNTAVRAFVINAGVVLDWIAGKTPNTWADVLAMNALTMPGSVQAGIDVDVERILPRAIDAVDKATLTVAGIARAHKPRTPSQDEQHWTAGMAPEDCCTWHYEVKPEGRYRRPRAGGTNCCQECLQVAEWAGRKPPEWFMEALIDRDSKPKSYDRALSRLADELPNRPEFRAG